MKLAVTYSKVEIQSAACRHRTASAVPVRPDGGLTLERDAVLYSASTAAKINAMLTRIEV